MRETVENENKRKEQEITAYTVRHLPIVKAYADRIGLVEIINDMIPSRMSVDPGTVFLGLVLDTLSGRTPLYRLDEFFETQDIGLLLGRDISAEKFSDYNVARVLDKAYEAGSMKIFSEISRSAVAAFGVDCRNVSFDTTSVNVYGKYDAYSKESSGEPFRITFGKSKDHRPDLKQFLISMLCVDRSVPVFGRTEDGNASDRNINNRILSEISERMSGNGIRPGGFIYTADSAAVTEENLKQIGAGILFITRLPATYNECGRVIKEAVEKDEWEDIGILALTEASPGRPAAYYKAYESKVRLYGTEYRAVVIHSGAHDSRRRKRADRLMNSEHKKLKKIIKKMEKEEFRCLPDAAAAAEKRMKSPGKYHRVSISIKEIPKFSPGRPPAGGIRRIKDMCYRLSGEIGTDDRAVEKLRREAGCFVMLTNVPEETEDEKYDARTVLKTYKDQHGIEQNFSFLKDPAFIDAVFLKKAERIEILGLVLLISLLIWRLIERSLRKYTEETGRDLPGWKKRRTERPTSFMLLTKFIGITVIKIGQIRRLNRPLTDPQKEYLDALDIDPEIFVNPGAG